MKNNLVSDLNVFDEPAKNAERLVKSMIAPLLAYQAERVGQESSDQLYADLMYLLILERSSVIGLSSVDEIKQLADKFLADIQTKIKNKDYTDQVNEGDFLVQAGIRS